MALIIYGSANSRTMRTLWLATELSLEFDHVPYEHSDPRLKEAPFLEISPFGTIPAIRDDDVMLSESLAINIYLAEKYAKPGSDLAIESAEHRALIYRWALWAQGSLEPWVQRDAVIRDLLGPIQGKVEEYLTIPLSALESSLQESTWLLGEHFTLADLCVANVLSPSRARQLKMARFPRIAAWLTACYQRPAARAARARFHE